MYYSFLETTAVTVGLLSTKVGSVVEIFQIFIIP